MFLQGGGKSSIAEAAAFFLRSQDTGKDRQALVPEDSQAGWCFFFKRNRTFGPYLLLGGNVRDAGSNPHRMPGSLAGLPLGHCPVRQAGWCYDGKVKRRLCSGKT
jgi:hypothetical protein